MLHSKHRLNAKNFQRVYTNGRKFRGEYGMLVVTKNPSNEYTQFGFVVSKKIGNAVQRHRMTRLLRQVTFDTLTRYQLLKTPFECQYIAFKYCDSYEQLSKEYTKQIIDAFGVTQEI